MNEQKELLKARNKDINEKIVKQKAIVKEGKNIEIQMKETEHAVSKINSSTKDATKQVGFCSVVAGLSLAAVIQLLYSCKCLQMDSLLNKYSWIADEKKFFGQPNTSYDFKANDPKEAGKRIEKLQETKDKLSKHINMRAMNMLSKTEDQVALFPVPVSQQTHQMALIHCHVAVQ